ncbi:protein-export membrane protein SecD [candidate division WOR-1 bacterium RIFOXYB2_FULL_42_35]|uniref:Protein translocase subunit SecD n=1 Tax=candidate division WOR-1 bacterium RIFOXYC2_FULL_41_25 TaxID=1802586 RepID=A0A1F4TIY6_UNCSA|nr:MAG: protein-export membrane protein SecD [candidate division WOR-1 bacterium RIFOXYA2_FULL_41_14]OGC21785.1 MAG: protein-export membrane protein SecD [candidate division WOR-1 bacterium RIFOXYB2_FULL_42_35]OGC32682.1 MAG: protein-export membrane protein SecD [candidate division WOR-1 bacterium RIFOXYC2_FULL_41_25]OGC41557.1 MAG: protein-export membrane protein SecD [candidate division WOR-1 bacterium RIFOXYD2_FULL_41_8]
MKKNINQLRILILLVIIGVSIYILNQMPINLGLDLQGGTRLVLEGQPTAKIKVTDDAMAGAVAVIRNRIDPRGVAEPIIQRKGRDQIVVELPGVKDPDRVIKLIGDTALLEFVEAEWAPADETKLTTQKVKDYYGEEAYLDNVELKRDGQVVSKRPIILKNTAITGSLLKGAWPGVDEYGNSVIDIEFDSEGASKFGAVTARSVGRPLAILLDKKVISAPNVREPIPSGKAQISGDFTIDEVQDLVIKLKAGALPIPVKAIETRIVGPTLGRDSIDKSMVAGLIGFMIIAAFMIFYYRLPGLLADIALGIYILIVLALLSLLHATLTLPGIAGLLLSIGMAVDANIIIFERLKEELRSKKTIRLAIDTSFQRALTAILDANLTTIIAAGTLFFVGTGSIKGFAVTLTVGIAASMFTSIVITRMLLDIVLDAKILADAKSKLVYR